MVIKESYESKKMKAQSLAVKWVYGAGRAQRPFSVPLQPHTQVITFPLFFLPMPQPPQVRLVHSQVQRAVHLWTKEERIQNTLAPRCGMKPRMQRLLNTRQLNQILHSQSHTEHYRIFQRIFFYYQTQKYSSNSQLPLAKANTHSWLKHPPNSIIYLFCRKRFS